MNPKSDLPRVMAFLQPALGARDPLRVLVLGVPGSGKTTWAKLVADELHLPRIEADEFFWGNGEGGGLPEFRAQMRYELERESFVAEGHFSTLKEEYLARINHVIYLDPPLPMVAVRLLQRFSIDRNRGRGGPWSLLFSLSRLKTLRANQQATVAALEAASVRLLRL